MAKSVTWGRRFALTPFRTQGTVAAAGVGGSRTGPALAPPDWKACVPLARERHSHRRPTRQGHPWLSRIAALTVLTVALLGPSLHGALGAARAEPAADAPAAPAADGGVDVRAGAEQVQESIRVIQQRPVLRALRAEIQAFGGVGMSDTLFQHFLVTGNARFHITEEWSIGGSYSHYFASTSGLFEDVTTDFSVFPEKSLLRWMAGLDAAFVPIYGKFALFDQHIVHYDFYALAGVNVLQTSRSDDIKVAGVLGLGWRVYLTRWLAFTTEVRDHMYVESFNAGDRFMSHFVFQAGFSMFLPFDFDYRFPR